MSQKAREFEAEILKRGYNFHTRFDRTEEEYIVSKDGLHYALLTEELITEAPIDYLLHVVENEMKVLINKHK